MARLLIFWSRPEHLSEAEAEGWIREALASLLADAAVARAEVTRLRSAAGRYSGIFDWMLELQLADAADREAYVRSAVCADLLADFRLLGMRPAAMVTDGSRVLGGGAA